jgi:hypothetical protein
MIASVYQGVFDTTYDVTFRDRLPTFSGCTVKGYIDPETDRIIIRRNLSPVERAITLLHETLHECYPEWDEKDIEACAQYTYDNLAEPDQAIVAFLATEPDQTR